MVSHRSTSALSSLLRRTRSQWRPTLGPTTSTTSIASVNNYRHHNYFTTSSSSLKDYNRKVYGLSALPATTNFSRCSIAECLYGKSTNRRQHSHDAANQRNEHSHHIKHYQQDLQNQQNQQNHPYDQFQTKVALPTLGQNGTLSLRSPINCNVIAQVHVVPQWREDSLIELISITDGDDDDDDNDGVEFNGATFAPDNTIDENISNPTQSTATTSRQFGGLNITLHSNGIATSLGRIGSFVEVDVAKSLFEFQQHQQQRESSYDTQKTKISPKMKIIATVPEKCNINLHVPQGDIFIASKLEGDIHLHGRNIYVSKLRGHNVSLNATSASSSAGTNNQYDENRRDDGTTRENNHEDESGTVYVSKAIEARSVQIHASKRVRARMMNGSDVSIDVTPTAISGTCNTSTNKLDDDDGGAVIDIGSLYVSTGASSGGGSPEGDENEARLSVDVSSNVCLGDGLVYTPSLARVKSSHGHVYVHAKCHLGRVHAMPSTSSEQNPPPPPLVDLGGVNGSCDVLFESSSSPSSESTAPSKLQSQHTTITTPPSSSSSIATRVHFDSMTPHSISTITSRGNVGDISLTIDRKLEADVRLLSLGVCNNPKNANANANDAVAITTLPLDVDAYDLASEDKEDIKSVLMDLDQFAMARVGRSVDRDGRSGIDSLSTNDEDGPISIETDAFLGKWGMEAIIGEGDDGVNPSLSIVKYTQGTVKNRSGEPDSRFDVRSRGKINIDGAASQALHGFHSSSSKNKEGVNGGTTHTTETTPTLPLLAVATDGNIKLETLSWLGSIARRYGLEESERSSLGRQASRAPRLEKK